MAENESGTQKQGIFCSVSSDSSKQHDTIIAAKAAFAKPFFMDVFLLVLVHLEAEGIERFLRILTLVSPL